MKPVKVCANIYIVFMIFTVAICDEKNETVNGETMKIGEFVRVEKFIIFNEF